MKCPKCGGETIEIKGKLYCTNCGDGVSSQGVVKKDTKQKELDKNSKQAVQRSNKDDSKKQTKNTEKQLKISKETNKISPVLSKSTIGSVDSIYSSKDQENESHPVLNDYDKFVQAEEKESHFRFEAKLGLAIGGILIIALLVLGYIFWWTPKLKVASYFSGINKNVSSLEQDLDRAEILIDILKQDSLEGNEELQQQLELSKQELSDKGDRNNLLLIDTAEDPLEDIEKNITNAKEGKDLCRRALEKIDSIKKIDTNNSTVEVKNTHEEILSRSNQLEEEFKKLESFFNYMYVDSNVGKEFIQAVQNINIFNSQSLEEFNFLMDTTSKRLTKLTNQLNSIEVTGNLKKLKEDEVQVINIFNTFINNTKLSVQTDDINQFLNVYYSFENQMIAALNMEMIDFITFWEEFKYEKDISEGKKKVKQSNELLEKIRINHNLNTYKIPLLWYGNEII